MANPKTPAGLKARGRAFWHDTIEEFELSRGERELLAECCRSLDQIDALSAAIASDGVTVRGSEGQPRVHPAVSQINATRTLLGRLLAQLSLPDPEGEAIPTLRQTRAQKAAAARWAEHNAAKATVRELHRGQA